MLWFQMGWWSMVISARNGLEALTIEILTLFLIFHFVLLSKNRLKDICYLILIPLIGVLGDIALFKMGLMQAKNSQLLPSWLIGIWFLFALTVPYSLKPLLARKLWSVPMGFIAAISYLAGQKLDLLEFPMGGVVSIFVLTVVWIVYIQLFCQVMVAIEKRLEN